MATIVSLLHRPFKRVYAYSSGLLAVLYATPLEYCENKKLAKCLSELNSQKYLMKISTYTVLCDT